MASGSHSHATRVLSVCADPLLRSTRQLVLSLRYICVSVGRVEDMPLLAGEDFDVVLLCHTLEREQCEQAIEVALHLWRRAQIVMLSHTEASYSPNAKAVVRTGQGPEYLLNSVDRLLLSKPATPFSPGWTSKSQGFGKAAGEA